MKILVLVYLFIFFATFPVSALNLSADSACLISADTLEIIYAKNETAKLPMASTTKIMTALLSVESKKKDEIVTVSKNAESQEGSSIYLRQNDKVSLNDLTYGLMLNSGNDAAVAIAEHLSGNVPAFAEKMTEKANEIGAQNTQFKNPNGLDEPGHFTTAYDLALISAYAMKNEDFYNIASSKSASGKTQSGEILYFNNHNKMLSNYEGAVGVKTGFTKTSGRCLVSAAERDGILLIAVTLNAPDDWNDHKKMLDFGFDTIKKQTLVKSGDILKTMYDGDEAYNFVAEKDVTIASLDNNAEIKVFLPEVLPAPINKGEKAGYAEVYYNKKHILSFDIISERDIKKDIAKVKKTYLDCILRTIKSIF